MTSPLKAGRIDRASVTLESYSQAASGDPVFYDDTPTIIAHLLADMMHYCAEYRIDWNACVAGAAELLNEEVNP